MKKIALLSILLLSVISLYAQDGARNGTADSNGLVFSLRTDKTRYALGENIKVTLTWENPTGKRRKIETSPMMGHVAVFNKDTNIEVPYRGVWACGTSGTRDIAAGDTFQVDNVLNNFLYPDRDLSQPGRYIARLDGGSCCPDQPGPSAEFEIVRLDEEDLREEREKALAGDKNAVQILAAHGDASAIPILASLATGANEENRRLAYRALLILNTEESMTILGERANAQIPVHEKGALLRSLIEMKEMPKAPLIPFMQTLLKDNFAGARLTKQNPGEPPKIYKLYTVRRSASEILKRFNIDPQVVTEEEIIEIKTP